MLEKTLPDLADRFRSLVEGVCRAVLAGNVGNRCPEPIINFILVYLRRLAARFANLAARPGKARPSPLLVQRAPRILPNQWGWLATLLPDPEPIIAELITLTNLPELLALSAAVPQLAKILRPFSVMLGVGLPPELRLPPTRRAIIAAECRAARNRYISLATRRRLGLPLVDRHHRPWVRPTLKRWLRSTKRPERY